VTNVSFLLFILLGKAGNKGGKQTGDIFDDLLGSQGYQFPKRETGPRTINEMRKEELARDMDPDKLRVSQQWAVSLAWQVGRRESD
jgi:hypothetical protein